MNGVRSCRSRAPRSSAKNGWTYSHQTQSHPDLHGSQVSTRFADPLPDTTGHRRPQSRSYPSVNELFAAHKGGTAAMSTALSVRFRRQSHSERGTTAIALRRSPTRFHLSLTARLPLMTARVLTVDLVTDTRGRRASGLLQQIVHRRRRNTASGFRHPVTTDLMNLIEAKTVRHGLSGQECAGGLHLCHRLTSQRFPSRGDQRRPRLPIRIERCLKSRSPRHRSCRSDRKR